MIVIENIVGGSRYEFSDAVTLTRFLLAGPAPYGGWVMVRGDDSAKAAIAFAKNYATTDLSAQEILERCEHEAAAAIRAGQDG